MIERKTALELPKSGEKPDTGPQTLREATPFTPQRRHPYPKLVIIDDDSQNSGECVRVRELKISIGRKQCDLVFPAESLMSARHAVLSLQEVSSQRWAWVLEDCESGNGLFVRLKEFPMIPGIEFLLGGTKIQVQGERLRPLSLVQDFDSVISPHLIDSKSLSGPLRLNTVPYAVDATCVTHPIQGRRITIGHSETADVRLVNDPFVEGIHAKLQSDGKLKWMVKDISKSNGIWLRVSRMIMSSSCQFMAGEQRFVFETPE